MASRSGFAPHVIAYWLTSARRRVGGRLLELGGGREVGEALGQADRAGLDREAVHLADDRLGEALGLAADAAHAGESSRETRV